MKNFFRHPTTITLITIIFIMLILSLLGFRITYNPSLDNNWDAISACAAWAAVVVSGFAIYFAIQSPKKISEEQNKIALFEKRFEVYKVLMDCFAFTYLLENTDTPDSKCLEVFHLTFNDNAKLNPSATWLEQMRTYSDVQNKLKMAEHLFGEEIGKEIALMLAALLLLIQTKEKQVDGKQRQLVYIQQSNKVENECTSKIKDLLSLK